MATDGTEHLRQVLLRQRECLKAGQLAELGRLAKQLEAAATGLNGPLAGPGGLAALRDLAQANSTLIRAAMKGVEAARLRLSSIRKANDGLAVYTAEGRAVRHGGRATAVERRV